MTLVVQRADRFRVHVPISYRAKGDEEWLLSRVVNLSESGILFGPTELRPGDDVEVIGRGLKLLKLASGAQAQARHESWKKRQVQLPHELKTASATVTAASKKDTDGPVEEK